MECHMNCGSIIMGNNLLDVENFMFVLQCKACINKKDIEFILSLYHMSYKIIWYDIYIFHNID